MKKEKIRTFAKLGYTHMDTAEIVLKLNKLLAEYQVFFQKLRCYHWNVTGADFFELHEKFESMYNQAYKNIDEIAEKIRLFGQKPLGTFYEYIQHSDIIESDNPEKLTAFEMVKDVLNDTRNVLSAMEDCIHSASEINDFGTEDMMKFYIRQLEKDHWMLTAWQNQEII